jgi:hypothetical protein
VSLRRLFSRPAAWWAVAIVIGAVLLFAAVNNKVYEATSPTSFDYHVILRKIYSIIAFATVGYPIARARALSGRSASLLVIGGVVAGYSAVIEVLQFVLDPPYEGFVSNVLDVAYGLAGGVFAAWLASRVKWPTSSKS